MTTLGKAGVAIASVGAIGGGTGVGLHLFNNYPTIKSRLALEGFDTNLNDAEWKVVSAAHNVASTKGFTAVGNEEKTEPWLRSKCNHALSQNDKDDTNYKLARQWCVKEESISTIWKKKGSKHKLLSVLATDTNTDKAEWIQKIGALSNNENAKTALNVQLNSDQAANIVAIKKGCENVIATKTTATDFNNKFDLAKEWCTK